ncbi:MAG: glutathione S-transferase family protein [Chloroflexi bacterium]|nr:glutathione S-transferase family protein [Chloroflexota bacterium]
MSRPILYSSIRSPHCLKVALFLQEKGIVFDRVEIDLPARQQKSPAYLRINPFGLVPAYTDDYGPHADSLLIMHYLEWRHPQPRLFPAAETDWPDALNWIERSSGPFRDVSHHLYWQIIEPPTSGTDWDRVAALKTEGIMLLDTLEAHLAHRQFMFGEFGVVDIALIPWVHGYRRFDLISAERHPHTAAWIERVSTRPSFQNNYQIKGRFFSGDTA